MNVPLTALIDAIAVLRAARRALEASNQSVLALDAKRAEDRLQSSLTGYTVGVV